MSYPLINAEHGSYLWLMREVGGYLFNKFDPAEWNHSERQQIDSIVQSGVSQFHHPPPLPVGEREKQKPAHSWSFLQPLATMQLEIDERRYDLPADFGGIVGEFTVQG